MVNVKIAEQKDREEIEKYRRKIAHSKEWVSDPEEQARQINFFNHQIDLIECRIERRRTAHSMYNKMCELEREIFDYE